MEAERKTGRTAEVRRQDVIKYRKESGVIKRKVLKIKRYSETSSLMRLIPELTETGLIFSHPLKGLRQSFNRRAKIKR